MQTIKMMAVLFTLVLLTLSFIPQSYGYCFSENDIPINLNGEFGSPTFGELSYEPHSYNFTDLYPETIANTTFEIWNSGCCSLIYNLIEDCPWVTIHPTHGVSSGSFDHHVINVTINTTDLDFGFHQCDIIIDTSDTTGIFKVSVNVIAYPNHTPNNPILIGPDRSEPNENVVFEAKATDPDDDFLFYQWNFNEENITEWMGPYESNDVCYIEYTWEDQGNYLVKVRVKDEHGNMTDWTQHVIQVPYVRSPFSFWQALIHFFFKIGTIFPFIL